jgi:integrase
MMKYYQDGRKIVKSTGTDDEKAAQGALNAATTDAGRGIPTDAKVGKLKFDTAAADLLADYENNDYDSKDSAEARIANHLTPRFGGMKLTAITTPLINGYIQHRRRQKAANGTINRELGLLRRMFTLAHRAGLIVVRPYIPKLEEHNVRKGFFEEEAFACVCRHLTPEIADVATVAYLTGWRVDSEILPLEWPQVDLKHGTITLEADTTKNDEPRVFPMTDELRTVFVRRHARRQAMKDLGHLTPFVFFREWATGRRGVSKAHKAYTTIAIEPRRIKRFNKQWKTACDAAGCPGRIPHDFRRTAIRNMSRRGIPERVAMTLSGHKTRAVFDRYRIVNETDLRDAQARLNGQLPPGMDTPMDTPAAKPAAAKTKSVKSFRKSGGAARI